MSLCLSSPCCSGNKKGVVGDASYNAASHLERSSRNCWLPQNTRQSSIHPETEDPVPLQYSNSMESQDPERQRDAQISASRNLQSPS
eukprot:3415232-Amphidinium_carterae.1